MKRQSVTIMAAILDFTGINVREYKQISFAELVRLSIYVLFLSYGFLGTIMYSITNFGDFYDFVIPMAYIGALTVLMSGVMLLFLNKENICYMIKYMDDNVFIYPDEENIRPHYTWLFSERNMMIKFILIMGYEITGYIFVCGSPFFGYIAHGHMKPYIYPGWTPWKVNGPVSFWLTYASQVGLVTTSLWGYYLTLTYIIFVVIEFLKQYKRLAEAVSTINQRAHVTMLQKINHSRTYKIYESNDCFEQINFHNSIALPEHVTLYNEIVRENIVMCVKHHQNLEKTFNLFKPWFSIAFSIDLGACMATYALVFYCLIEVNNFERMTSLMGVAFVAIANLFARCIIGEIFASLNDDIMKVIFYETNFPNQTNINKQLLLIFQTQTNRSMNLYGYGIFQASLFTFSNIIRASYSYLNLIRASLHN